MHAGKVQGWRKFIICGMTLVMAFWLALQAKLSPDFVSVVSIIVVAYVGGNAFEHHVKGKTNAVS